jgi:hypothetical protein
MLNSKIEIIDIREVFFHNKILQVELSKLTLCRPNSGIVKVLYVLT